MTSPTIDRRFGLVGNAAFKAPVTVVATGNITQSGQQTIDGVAVLAINSAGVPDRVLCAGMTDASKNGIWDVSTAAWTRSKDADGNYDLVQGTTVAVNKGTVGAGSFWQLTTTGTIIVGTTAMTWTRALVSSLNALSFLQAGTGAASRGAQDKMRDIVSVRDFGALGVGGSGDNADIQAALNASLTVYVPRGDYTINTVLSARGSCCIYGEEWEQTIFRTSSSNNILEVGGGALGNAGSGLVSGIWFRKDHTYNNGSTYVTGTSTSITNRSVSQRLLKITNAQKFLVHSCSFQDGGVSLEFINSSYPVVTFCKFNGHWDADVAGLQECSASLNVTGPGCENLYVGQRCSFGGSGLIPSRVSRTIGSVTTFVQHNTGPLVGIQVDHAESGCIVDSYIGGQSGNCIKLSASGALSGFDIARNFIDSARAGSVRLECGVTGNYPTQISICDNHFQGYGIEKCAILAADTALGGGDPSCTNLTISGNHFQGHMEATIQLFRAVGFNIFGNQVRAYNYITGYAAATGGVSSVLFSTTDPTVQSGCYVDTNCNDGTFGRNSWGGGINNPVGANNCKYGIYGAGTPTNITFTPQHNSGLGLAGGLILDGFFVDPEGAWIASTPTPAAGAGAFGAGIAATYHYNQRGKNVSFEAVVTFGAAGAGTASGFVSLPLPVTPKGTVSACGRANGVSGKALASNTASGGTTLFIRNYDGTYPGANNEVLNVSGTYEAA